jgi:potassium-dependent mechanosensitive channel
MYKIAKAIVLTILVLSTFCAHESFAQNKRKKPKTLRESARKSMHSRDSVFQAISKNDTSINSLLQKVEQYTTTFNQINNSLAEGLDTTDVSQNLPIVVRRIGKIQTLANTKKSSTLRYLFVLRDNLDHLQDQLEGWQSDLDDVNTKLIQNQHDILQFTKDSLLKIVPGDSVLKNTYLTQRKAVKVLWRKTDSVNRSNLFKVNFLQNKVTTAYSNILDESDQIDSKIRRFAARAETGEFGYLWESNNQYGDFNTAMNGTVKLNTVQLSFFFKNETITHLIALLFLLIVAGWIFYNRSRAAEQSANPEIIQDHINYIYTKPIVSIVLIVTAIAPYFYDHPPVFFQEICFLISLICTMVLVKKTFSGSLFSFLLQLFGLAIIYSLSNLLVQITNADRYAILLLSIAAVVIALVFYQKVRKVPEGYPPFIKSVLIIFMAMQFISFVLNVTGRFSLAKIVGVTAVFNLWMLMSLYFIIMIIIQGIFLQFHTKKAENTFISWIDYSVLQKKFRSTLIAFAALLWAFYLLQNLNIDDFVHDYLADVLNQSRTIGGSSFTFGGFVIFIIVIYLSTLLSKVISYFYDISAQHTTDLSALKKKNRASTLLIRIGVFTVGFLLAVAASGFPIDKLTIIFSAFGVGIGFGLQNIVNNLVSGMILAFEKPVQIGDIIEVDSHLGTIKEIGIRSSKLATGDGSEVIIPNGDMISHQVVNWTLSNTNRRVEMLISAAYGSDIEKVKKLLIDLLGNRDDIMTSPGPTVLLNGITDKSIDFKVSFWAADISTSQELRSKILTDIFAEFSKEGIEMPKA